MRPVYVEPRLESLFCNVIARFLEEPTLWHPRLAPIPRLFLLFGQKGSGMDEAIVTTAEKYKIRLENVRVLPNGKFSNEGVLGGKGHLLIIRKAHHLLNQQPIDFKKTITGYQFIIVVSEIFPQPEENHLFWDQFKMENIIIMGLPTKEFYRTLLEYYFTMWQAHWNHSKVALSTADYENLSIACAYCIPRDIKLFVQRVFQTIIRAHGQEEIDVTLEYLEKNHMYNPSGIEGVYTITKRDVQKIQRMYELGGGVTGPADAPRDGGNERKRARITETSEIIP